MAKPGNGWHRRRPDTPAALARKRKYDSAEHRAARAHLKLLVTTGRASCWRCGTTLQPGHWHVGHNDTGDRIMGGECASCNVRAAAIKGNRIANAKRKAQRFVRPVR